MYKKYLLVLLLIAVAVSAISCTRLKNPSRPDIRSKLDSLMTKSLIKYKSPGMILAVWVPGKGEYVRAIGFSDLTIRRKLEVSDRFRIGSNTKTYVATVVLQLVDEGKLKMDDKLSKFFSYVPNSNNITIRTLLNHTSGLFNYSEDKDFSSILENDLNHPFTPRQLVGYGIKNPPYFEPGKGFHYSNTNTVLLGMIVGKVTGSTLELEMKRRLFDKLGLKNTYFPKGSETNGPIVHGYMLEDNKYQDFTKMNVSWGWAAGAMISDIYDLKKAITAVTDGSLLSKQLQKERMTSWVNLSDSIKKEFPSARYGYNVFTMGGFVGHNGGMPGYISLMLRDPKNGATIIMLMNTQPKASDASLYILKEIIGIIMPNTEV
jgi:D-alanyl-D-alanine carboxypeptidase